MLRFGSPPATDLTKVWSVVVPEPVGWHDEATYRDDLEAGRCRPEWSWIAEDDDTVIGRALWWGLPDSTGPLALECLYIDAAQPDRVGVAAALLEIGLATLTASGSPPPFTLALADGWRDDPAAVEAVAWRREAVRHIGLTEELERIRFEWTPADGLPEHSDRLTFHPELDDAAFASALVQVSEGSLDVETRREIESLGPELAAQEDLAFYRSMPGERSWWQLARTPDGALAGLIIPSRNAYGPNVGYLGVVPEFRGQGFVHDLLAEMTRFHAADGAQKVTATTDATNTPMAAAFRAAGYRATGRRLTLSAPHA